MRDIEAIDSELRLVAALRWAARERGGPLPSIDVADAMLDSSSSEHRSARRPLRGRPDSTHNPLPLPSTACHSHSALPWCSG
jgi:hypothetical protein